MVNWTWRFYCISLNGSDRFNWGSIIMGNYFMSLKLFNYRGKDFFSYFCFSPFPKQGFVRSDFVKWFVVLLLNWPHPFFSVSSLLFFYISCSWYFKFSFKASSYLFVSTNTFALTTTLVSPLLSLILFLYIKSLVFNNMFF